MKHSDELKNLAKALAKFQADIKDPARDKDNPYFNRMYEIQKDMNDNYERSDAGKQRKGKKSSSNKPKELKQVDTAVKSVSKLNKEIKAIRNDPKKDPDQKRREIDQRRTKINDLAKKVVLKFDK